MPLIASTYRVPFGFSNGHVQTIVPVLFRSVGVVTPARERIRTPDGDFLDLDRADSGSRRVAILSHGLEGNSRTAYMQGMARAFIRRGWDVVAWNFRGCSGEPNRRLQSYHSGATGDLEVALGHVLAPGRYERAALVGFSLGGNVTLKFLGEQSEAIDPRIAGAVTFSVPCDLAASSARLATRTNRIYMRRFLRTMGRKIADKARTFPGQVDLNGLAAMRTFAEFDDRFTAPIHGFAGAEDYWSRSSCRPFLAAIRVPVLIVNARNDPFLAATCFPATEAEQSPFVHLETPRSGGHIGFVTFGNGGEYWSEARATAFLGQDK
jgi:hypothetical protein